MSSARCIAFPPRLVPGVCCSCRLSGQPQCASSKKVLPHQYANMRLQPSQPWLPNPLCLAVLRGSEATDRRCQILRRLLTRCNPDMAFYLVRERVLPCL